jgi:hypothetical protein
MKIHTMASGATLIVTSPGHGFRFSDGTSCDGQDKSVCDGLTCKRTSRKVGEIKGHVLNETLMRLDDNQLEYLRHLCTQADLVMIAFPVLAALREQGVRDRFPNAVAMNATLDTQRVAPDAKVVDVQNWSY